MAHQRGEVCILARDDALIVANDGRAVTRRGVLALAASDLTEKSERPEDLPDDIPGVSDRDFLQAIRTRVVETYRLDPNRLKRDARREIGVSADYGGRYLGRHLLGDPERRQARQRTPGGGRHPRHARGLGELFPAEGSGPHDRTARRPSQTGAG